MKFKTLSYCIGKSLAILVQHIHNDSSIVEIVIFVATLY
jgi:hypothetical protein